MTFKLKKLVVSTAAALVVSVSPALLGHSYAEAGFIVQDAAADESGHDSGKKGKQSEGVSKGGKKSESAASHGSRKGKKSVDDLLSSEEDSDRPAWAGTSGKEGKPGGGSAGGTTKKGGDYGDIVVMLRNDDGTLVQDGNTTYAVAADGSIITIVDGEIPEGSLVQAVEFGRLNIARAPSKVLDHSLVEALSKLDGGVVGETLTLDPAGRLVTADGSVIDSPLENLAIYEALLTATASDGVITLSATASKDGSDTTYTITAPESMRLDLAASALAAASDKTGELTIDEIVGISSFIGVDDELASFVTTYSYDRQTTYDGLSVWVLVENNGVYVPTEVNLYDTVQWSTIEANSIKDNTDGGIDVFTQAADDAVQALEYVHDNALDQ